MRLVFLILNDRILICHFIYLFIFHFAIVTGDIPPKAFLVNGFSGETEKGDFINLFMHAVQFDFTDGLIQINIILVRSIKI